MKTTWLLFIRCFLEAILASVRLIASRSVFQIAITYFCLKQSLLRDFCKSSKDKLMLLNHSSKGDQKFHLSHSDEIDFTVAGYFTAYFAKMILEREFPENVHLLKVEVPSHATPETGWQVGRLSRNRYYDPVPAKRGSWEQPGPISYKHSAGIDEDPEDTDAHILRTKKMVAVTPINLDMTAPVILSDFEKRLRS